MHLGENHFFAHVLFDQELTGTNDQIQIGYSSDQGKVVKLNHKPVQSYKELLTAYRIVTLTADDLSLIHSAPEARRSFMNYSLFLIDPECAAQLKRYKLIVDQRNKLLSFHGAGRSSSFHDELTVWTEKMWVESQVIRAARKDYLEKLETHVNILLEQFFWSSTDNQLRVKLEYVARQASKYENFESFWSDFSQQGLARELQYGRSTFGAHLDDITIIFQQKNSRIFASRGQQKLLVFLLKIAQLQLTNTSGEASVLLLDDFVTDFDEDRLKRCLHVLQSIPGQIFISSPLESNSLLLEQVDSQRIAL